MWQYFAASLDKFDQEYHRQNKGTGLAHGVFAVTAGKSAEHCLRFAPSLQALRDGIALKKLVKGSRRMPLADGDGNPVYLKKLLHASETRTDLKLGEHYMAGDVHGAGLTPTVELPTARLATAFACHAIKVQYVETMAAIEGATLVVPGADADAAASLEEEVDRSEAEKAAAATAQSKAALIEATRGVLASPLFYQTGAAMPKEKAMFKEACLRLEENHRGYFFEIPMYSGGGANCKVGFLEHGFVKSVGGDAQFFIKSLSHKDCESELAGLGLDIAFDYDALMHDGKAVLGKAAKLNKEKLLRLFTFVCSLSVAAKRGEVLTEPGPIRTAAIKLYAFSGGHISKVLAATEGSDNKRREVLDKFLHLSPKELKDIHMAVLQLAILAKQQLQPSKYSGLELLEDVPVPRPCKRPALGASSLGAGSDDDFA